MQIIICIPDEPIKSIPLAANAAADKAKRLVKDLAAALPMLSRVSLLDGDELIFQVENH